MPAPRPSPPSLAERCTCAICGRNDFPVESMARWCETKHLTEDTCHPEDSTVAHIAHA